MTFTLVSNDDIIYLGGGKSEAMMKYKGYTGKVKLDDEAGILQ